jgi:RimJ/RimL family protein N-acetyltransferase
MNPWQPTLVGPTVALRPIVSSDLDGMHAAASDPLVWEQHSERNRHERSVFERFFRGALECGGGLAITERDGGRIIGSSRYYDWDPSGSSIVIGYTFLERAHWGGRTNREVKSLMLAHAFDHVATAWFHVSPGNVRSQRALERIGARLDRREQVPVGGVPSDRLIYRIDRELAVPADG